MDSYFDIIIAGGGVVGLSAAIAMRQKGFSVAVVDAGPLVVDISIPDLRVYALNQASQRLLNNLSIWNKVDQSRVSPYSRMHVEDAANGAYIDFDARMIGQDRLGGIIEESSLKHAALEQAQQDEVVLFPNCPIREVQSTEQGIMLQAGTETLRANLLIASDGAHSAVRELLQVPITSWPYHQHAIITRVQTELSHQNTAWQLFTETGPLAFLPLTDMHQCSIVWSTSSAHANHLMHLSNQEFAQQITCAFNHKLGNCEVLAQQHQFPLVMRHAKQYCGQNWILMGDAAHTIHPLAGLGLNVGLADLACWIKQVKSNNKGIWTQKALGAYQRERKAEVWQIIALMGGLKTLFLNPLAPVIALRGLGINACNQFSPLKRLFIEYAAGHNRP